MLAGAGFIAICIATQAANSASLQAAGLAAAVAYALWAACLFWVFWNMQTALRTFRGMAVQPRT